MASPALKRTVVLRRDMVPPETSCDVSRHGCKQLAISDGWRASIESLLRVTNRYHARFPLSDARFLFLPERESREPPERVQRGSPRGRDGVAWQIGQARRAATRARGGRAAGGQIGRA